MNRRDFAKFAAGAAALVALPLAAKPAPLTQEEIEARLKSGLYVQPYLNGEHQPYVTGCNVREGWLVRAKTDGGPWGKEGEVYWEPVHGDFDNWQEGDESRLAVEKVYGRVECYATKIH